MKIYEVKMTAMDGDGDEETWTDSYWTTAEAAIDEARSYINNPVWPGIDEITVFERAVNVSGAGQNVWNDEYDKLIFKKKNYETY